LRHVLPQPSIHAFYFVGREVIRLFGFDEAVVDTFRPQNMETIILSCLTENGILKKPMIRFWDTDALTHVFYITLENEKIKLSYRGQRPPPRV